MRHFLRPILLGLLAVVLGGAGSDECFGGCSGSGQMMRRYGYTEVSPPSNLFQPGAVVAISHRRPFTACLVCGPRASLGPSLQVHQSPTAQAVSQKMNGRNFRMQAMYLEAIRADARFSSVNNVSMTLNNAHIVEINDTDVMEGVANRSEVCKRSIQARLARGYRITMIQSALSGDVVYRVSCNSEVQMDAKAKLNMMDQLAVELGGGATSVSAEEIRAQDLVWGIRDSDYLVTMGISDDILPTPESAPDPMQSYLFANMHRANILPIPDAPVVQPTNWRQSLDGYEDVEEQNTRLYRQPTRTPRQGAVIYDPRHTPFYHGENDPTDRDDTLSTRSRSL